MAVVGVFWDDRGSEKRRDAGKVGKVGKQDKPDQLDTPAFLLAPPHTS